MSFDDGNGKHTDEVYPIRIPPDMSPADVLEVVVGLCQEIRHPLNKIEAMAAVLGDQGLQEHHPKAIDEIQQWIGGIRYILSIVYAYDAQREHDDELDDN